MMNVGEMMKHVTITKEVVDKYNQTHVEIDYKVKTTTDYEKALLDFYHGGGNQGMLMGWEKTHDHFRIRDGEVTILQGQSGHGKTMWLSQLIIHLLKTTKCVIASMEMKPVLSLQRMITQCLGSKEPTDSYIKEFLTRLEEKLYIYDQQGTTSSRDIEAMIFYGVHVLGCKVFVVDSLMKMSDIAEDNYDGQKKFVDRLTTIARDTDCHIFLVCHTKKLDESFGIPESNHILGSGHIRNLADNILCLWRNVIKERQAENGLLTEEDLRVKPDAKLIIQKQRNFVGENSESTINFWYDKKGLRYKERP